MEGREEQPHEEPRRPAGPSASAGRDPGRSPAAEPARPADLALAPLEDERIYRVLPDLFDAGRLYRSEACRLLGGVSHTTVDRHLQVLCDLGIVERAEEGPRGSVVFRLTEAGRKYRAVFEAAERCLGLDDAGGGHAAAAELASKRVAAIRVLWRSKALRLLMLEPISIADLSAKTTGASQSAIRRALHVLREAGLLEARSGKGRSEDFWATERGYAVAGLLLGAYRWERPYIPKWLKPLSSGEILAVMEMVVARLRAEELPDGTYSLLVDLREEPRPKGSDPAASPWLGMVIEVRNGSIQRRDVARGRPPDQLAGVEGDPDALLELAVTGSHGRLGFTGKKRSANRLAKAVHRTALTGPDADPFD